VDMVHKALGNYKCTIVDLVVEEPKAFARMEFSGIHSGRFMGYEPTGKIVSWAGCALFTFKNNKVLDLWVLGDLKALDEQLKKNELHRLSSKVPQDPI
ncbi:MAG: ester cyclase, partial [Pseudanabaena sp.]